MHRCTPSATSCSCRAHHFLPESASCKPGLQQPFTTPPLFLYSSHTHTHFTLVPSAATSYYARYYAFISKYLDSTDLFPLFSLLVSSFFLCASSAPPRSPSLVFTACVVLATATACAHYPSPAHCPLLLLFSLTRTCARTLSLPSLTHSLSPFSFHSSCVRALFLCLPARLPLHYSTRTCQSRAAVAATQILDTQYPSFSGKHFFTPGPDSRRLPGVPGARLQASSLPERLSAHTRAVVFNRN